MEVFDNIEEDGGWIKMLETLLTKYVWFSVIYAIIVLAYSVYLLYLNRKQARVVDLLEKTNQILEEISRRVK